MNLIYLISLLSMIHLSHSLRNTKVLSNTSEGWNPLMLYNCSLLLIDLSRLHKIYEFRDCLKERIVDSLIELADKDLIRVSDGINILKSNTNGDSNELKALHERKFVRDVVDNGPPRVLEKIVSLLKSRVLTIDLGNVVVEGRGRHGHKMSSMIVFALVATGLILAPMGFKFLVVLGTKALLLAMLAMILTSIQGLKKIATSKINYGLYDETHIANPCTSHGNWHAKLGNDQSAGYNSYLNPRDSIGIKRIENDYGT